MRLSVLICCNWLFLIGSLCAQSPGSSAIFNDLRYLSSDDVEGRKSGTIGNKVAREYIVKRFEEIGLKSFEGGYVREFAIPESKKIDGNKGYNIIGYLEGNSDKAIVISAHYDHLGIKGDQIYNGSDDNASGVAAILYMADQMKNRKLEHTIIFSALDAEESGLLGGYAFVKNPPVDIDLIEFNINLDMVSKNDKGELYACGTYHYPNLKPFINSVKTGYPIKIRLGHDRPGQGHDDWTNSSDHAAFHKAGIPFLYFGVEDHPDYHKLSDTYDRTNFEFFQKVAATLTDIVIKLDLEDLSKFAKN